MSTTRLPPFPDQLLDPAKKDLVIGWLRGRETPSRIARSMLQRWALVAGVELEPSDYHAVSSKISGRAPAQGPFAPLPSFRTQALALYGTIRLVLDLGLVALAVARALGDQEEE